MNSFELGYMVYFCAIGIQGRIGSRCKIHLSLRGVFGGECERGILDLIYTNIYLNYENVHFCTL